MPHDTARVSSGHPAPSIAELGNDHPSVSGSRRYILEQRTQSLRHRRVRQNGVAQPQIWQIRQHRRLHRRHDFSGLGANHREAENTVIAAADENLHEALRFACRRGPPYSIHRQSRDPRIDASALRFALAQSDVRERRLGEHAVWNQPIARTALASSQIVPDDPKVVDRDVRKLRTAGAFSNRPDTRHRRLQPLIDTNIAAAIQFDAYLLKPD